jgi:acyl-CoA thioester hydrolase
VTFIPQDQSSPVLPIGIVTTSDLWNCDGIDIKWGDLPFCAKYQVHNWKGEPPIMDGDRATDERHPLQVELAFKVKTYDIDFAGIVSNIVYVRWLEDLRCEMLMDCFPMEEQLEQGIYPVLIRTEIDYRKVVRLGEKPIGRMWAVEGGGVKWILEAEFTLDDEVVAQARQEGVFVHQTTHRPVRMPEGLKRAIRGSDG